MSRGMRSICILAVCLAAAHLAQGAPAHGRKVLQTIAASGGACGAAANARCRSGQCCSQYGWCGTTTGHCGTGCQASWSGKTCAGAATPPSTTLPPPGPVTRPPPPPTTGCKDANAACAAWGPTNCIYPGVAQTCPCMCGANTVTPQPPVVPPQPPVTPPQPPVTAPPAPPTTGCKDANAACAAWGPTSCIYGGVPQTCPCMCSGGTTTQPPVVPPQPPVAPPQPPVTPPQPPVTPPPATGGSVSSLISAQQWETIFANRNNPACQGAATNFYNYDAFIQAAAAFPGFATSSDTATNKRELAAFLAQISHETTGGWATAPGGPYAWGLCFTVERIPGTSTPAVGPYCDAKPGYPCAPGKTYIGRGPVQLTWNTNYIQAGRAIGFDGLNNPEIVATDPVIAFKTAIWFWMTPQAPKPSCHDVMTGRFVPAAADVAAGRVSGYGLITNIINGGIECGKGSIIENEANRIGFFQQYAQIMGVSTGDNLNCANQQSYPPQ